MQLEIVDIYSKEIANQKQSIKIFDHRKKTGIMEQIASYFERDNLDIGVWAKTVTTKNFLSKYQKIKNNFIQTMSFHENLMLFDYPTTKQELIDIITGIKPEKLHLMNYTLDENIENYIKQILGMIKYATNHLSGMIELQKFSTALGVSDKFVQISFDILEDLGSINVIDVERVEYIKPFNYLDFKKSPSFEELKEDFTQTIEFKKSLLECNVKEFEMLIK